MSHTTDYMPARLVEADVMRAIAIAAVVVTHSVDPLQKAINDVPADGWWTADIYMSATRFCVPLFFMLSGYLLIEKDEPPLEFYRKRGARILVPYLAWSVFYLILRYTVGGAEFTPAQVARELATGRTYFHLWFVYVIAGIYLVTPLVRAVVRRIHRPWLLMAGLLAYTTATWYFGLPRHVPLFTAYLFYFIFGYYAGRWKLDGRHLFVAGAMVLAGAAFGAYETYRLSVLAGAYQGSANSFTSPYSALLSMGIFLLLHGLDYSRINPRIVRSACRISLASYGTYLMHPVVLSMFQRNPHGLAGYGLGIDTLLAHPALSIPVATALALTICAAAVLAMRRVWFLRYMV